mmetsp:Transcript_8566/g.13438  ORF Transcript_8566/g.13438 Transcript_8566/m.13438 type:complete len:145 (-) Transcript_8566:3-437(-)
MSISLADLKQLESQVKDKFRRLSAKEVQIARKKPASTAHSRQPKSKLSARARALAVLNLERKSQGLPIRSPKPSASRKPSPSRKRLNPKLQGASSIPRKKQRAGGIPKRSVPPNTARIAMGRSRAGASNVSKMNVEFYTNERYT